MKLLLTHICLIVAGFIQSQTMTKSLLQANVIQFHNKLFIYGYEQQQATLVFKCYGYDNGSQLNDSIDFNLGKHNPADYLEITVDTIHQVLNFYFQLANEKNEVTLLRLNDTLGKICSANNYDANHINSIAAFDDEKYIYKNDLYVIRTNKDTGGTQFYLNKYHLKTMLKPFEYEDKWQFAFERQFIHRASVIYADSTNVMVYAHVDDGLKKGQWILRINAITGEIIKGTRLGGKMESESKHFLYSHSVYDIKSKSIAVIGSIYESNMIDFKKHHSNFVNLSKRHQLFLICIDSLGEVTSKTEKLIALPLQTNKTTFVNSYHLKINSIKKTADNGFDVWADMYDQSFQNTFVYYSSWHFDITPNDIDYAITPSKFLIASNAVPTLISYTKGDSYGKFILDNIGEYDKFKYKKPINQILIKSSLDDVGNTFFILKKTDILLGIKSYYYVFMGKKGLENKVLLTSKKEQQGKLFFINSLQYFSFMTNTENTRFELKLNKL